MPDRIELPQITWLEGGCHDLLLRCMDYRRPPEEVRRLVNLVLGGNEVPLDLCDDPGTIGGSAQVLDDEEYCHIFEAIDIAVHHHGVQRIVLVDHWDCVAHGGTERFEYQAEELRYHKEQLQLARSVLQEYAHDNAYRLEFALVYIDRDAVQRVW